jgi:putative ABC transport system substrate-binding protein
MHRREVIRRLAHPLLLFAVVALSSATAAADAAGPRIGFLSPTTPEGSALVLDGLREGLREHGYVEGTNIAIESRYANGRFDRLPNLARELIALPVDVLVTVVTQATIAARDNTKTIPIVMIGVSDPVASGLVSSLSRPGANVTGTAGMFSDMAGKQLQLLNEAIPGVRRIAVLWNPANRVFQMQLIQETEAAARPLGVELRMFEARDPESIERAFVAISKERVSGLNVLLDPTLAAQGAQIATLAARTRLPSISGSSVFAEAGGLMSYGPSFPELARGAGSYVAKILKGAMPAELPVERPTKFEFVINMQTAKQIGFAVPASLRLRADRIID